MRLESLCCSLFKNHFCMIFTVDWAIIFFVTFVKKLVGLPTVCDGRYSSWSVYFWLYFKLRSCNMPYLTLPINCYLGCYQCLICTSYISGLKAQLCLIDLPSQPFLGRHLYFTTFFILVILHWTTPFFSLAVFEWITFCSILAIT